jgi:predicted GIY-YIG superfamily endonuclease
VYCIAPKAVRASYVGWTNNFASRLRKHRGEIKGGARYTSKLHAGEHWALRFLVHGFPTRSEAMSLEKQLQQRKSPVPRAHRRARNAFGTGPTARRAWALQRPRFSSSPPLVVYWRKSAMYATATALAWPPNVTHVCEEPAFL